jgi:hypothetical protein
MLNEFVFKAKIKNNESQYSNYNIENLKKLENHNN